MAGGTCEMVMKPTHVTIAHACHMKSFFYLSASSCWYNCILSHKKITRYIIFSDEKVFETLLPYYYALLVGDGDDEYYSTL